MVNIFPKCYFYSQRWFLSVYFTKVHFSRLVIVASVQQSTQRGEPVSSWMDFSEVQICLRYSYTQRLCRNIIWMNNISRSLHQPVQQCNEAIKKLMWLLSHWKQGMHKLGKSSCGSTCLKLVLAFSNYLIFLNKRADYSVQKWWN